MTQKRACYAPNLAVANGLPPMIRNLAETLNQHLYVEGNAWNYRFYVPHDMRGLIKQLGGDETLLNS